MLYKEEIESAMRTPNFGGFELLGLRDYQGQWTAVVGMLDVFTDSKGIITPQEHKKYCSAIVPLARLPKRVFTNDEMLNAEIDIANFSFDDLLNQKAIWMIVDEKNDAIAKGEIDTKNISKGKLTRLNNISFPLKSVHKVAKLILKISLPDIDIENTWDIWVYPKNNLIEESDIKIISSKEIDRLEKLLNDGEKVLLVLNKPDLKDARESCFATIFWNSIFKWPQKSHTLGIYCNPQHPVFLEFPTENHSNWQWWDIAMNANALNLDSFPREFEPLIFVIDSYHFNNKLTYLFEAKVGKGKLIVSTINLLADLDKKPATNQLKNSIINYMNSDLFQPKVEIQFEEINKLVTKPNN